MAIVLMMIGLTAVSQNDLAKARIYVYGGLLATMLIALSGLFNLIAINDSKKNNYNRCEAKIDGMKRFQQGELYCDYSWYYITVILSFLSSLSIVMIMYKYSFVLFI